MNDDVVLTLLKGGASWEQAARQASLSVADAQAAVARALGIFAEGGVTEGEIEERLDLARLDTLMMGLWAQAVAGDTRAIAQAIDLMDRRKAARENLPDTLFPASEATPGQAESRSAYEKFEQAMARAPWYEAYLGARQDGWDWRKAAYIAWESMPSAKRVPRTIDAFAKQVLGLRTASTIRKWRANDAAIDEAIGALALKRPTETLNNVIQAWEMMAQQPTAAAHRDRITYLDWRGVYSPKDRDAVGDEKATTIKVIRGVSMEDL